MATSTSFIESAVINAPISAIWPLIKLDKFGTFYKAIQKSELVPATPDERETVRWYFENRTILTLREEEYSTIKHSMSFNIIACEPWGLPYAGALSTLRLYPITSGAAEGSTYVEWRGQYSSDASAEVIEDAKLKRREGLTDLYEFFREGIES
ncbi:hypothetical protein HYALB_00010871 [Hymenoscyphus albidus]|uniref:Bet v1-like protein n=1 Tax=Hymenoscyphus albidus TaxID=595503 RepID=A0A9N9LSG2_9HELO|nr:hypothetical protein HYALB_00010871 [Hymenoscyphus albidus]